MVDNGLFLGKGKIRNGIPGDKLSGTREIWMIDLSWEKVSHCEFQHAGITVNMSRTVF